MTTHEEIEERTETNAVGLNDLWKWIATIALSCAISFGGHFFVERSQYMSKADVGEMIDNKQDILENEMKHYDSALRELKQVVENNNTIMQGVREELASMRQDMRNLLNNKKINE